MIGAAVDMNQIVIGEHISGEAPMLDALEATCTPAPIPQTTVKEEIAHGVATLGVVQPIVEATSTVDVSVATARASRKRTTQPSNVPKLAEEFPINEVEVHVPHGHAGKITHHSWELVIAHTADGVVVQPEGEPPSEISID